MVNLVEGMLASSKIKEGESEVHPLKEYSFGTYDEMSMTSPLCAVIVYSNVLFVLAKPLLMVIVYLVPFLWESNVGVNISLESLST